MQKSTVNNLKKRLMLMFIGDAGGEPVY